MLTGHGIGKTTPGTTVLAGYPIERLSGPEIVAYLLHWGLFGTLSVQLYLYYLAFPKDRNFTKYLVYGVYIVEFVQTMFVTHDALAMFGYGFGDLEALTRMDFNWLVVPVMGGVVACVGQVFYAYRIFILSRSRIVPAFVTCVSSTSSVAAILTGVYTFEAGDVTKLNNRKMSIAIGIWCGGSALCDVVIAISVVVKLSLILFIVFPHQTFYGTPMFIMPKLYANTVYMVLNSRIRIMGGRDTYTSSTDTEITTTVMEDITSHSRQSAQRTDRVQRLVSVVTITKEVFTSEHEMSRMSEKPQDRSMILLA
ncbi:hypothetical protein EV421DRAFT_1896271 [Armillaria borealis]|uniref:Transmembrane protein n=1 Tax=Armillaria borealis TaxID=47425 RepID=A0AA39K4G2_9AGAR|nr:hypothetical protein EV421DRAFT_1896271 [Armillaria borealis]